MAVHGGLREYESLMALVERRDAEIRSLQHTNIVIHAKLSQEIFEKTLALTHDRQPYPTAEAYEKACESLNRLRTALAETQAREATLREALAKADALLILGWDLSDAENEHPDGIIGQSARRVRERNAARAALTREDPT